MYERVLGRCRQSIRARRYIVTVHAEEEMEADGYNVLDLEAGIAWGRILERQRDEETNEWKYRIAGKTISGEDIEQIVKFSPSGMLVIITVYRP